MGRKRVTKKVKPTLLAVGEGYCEKAFLAHLKGLYSDGSVKITICTAKGKGPEHIIRHAISCQKCDGYDAVIVLLDKDLKWPMELVKSLKGSSITLIGSEPCLEGLLLDILEIAKKPTSNECKKVMHPLLSGQATDRDSYKELYRKDLLDSASLRLKSLKVIIKSFKVK
jgi:hypothetical protein